MHTKKYKLNTFDPNKGFEGKECFKAFVENRGKPKIKTGYFSVDLL